MNPGQDGTRRATYQDVIDAPAHRVAEIVDGRLCVSPRPPPLAALAKSHLRFALGPPFDRVRDGPGGWWIWHEPELHFGDDVLVPDVTGWRRERMPVRGGAFTASATPRSSDRESGSTRCRSRP